MRTIFVGGVPRSGTTMLGALLGGHPQVLCVPEAQFKWEVLDRALREPAATEGHWLQEIARHPRFKLWNMEPPAASPEAPAGPDTAQGALEAVVRAYGRSVGRETCGVWVDHCPNNMKFVRLLSRAYPDARFIHLVRDGRAVASSVMPLDWGPNTIVEATSWWLASMSFGLAAELTAPDRVLRVRYEDLTADPEAVLRRICPFLGLTFDAAMLEGKGHSVVRYTQSQHSRVGGPPDASRAQAWRAALTPDEVRHFEYYAGEVLEHLGYELVEKATTRPFGMAGTLRLQLREGWRTLVNRAYRRPRREREGAAG